MQDRKAGVDLWGKKGLSLLGETPLVAETPEEHLGDETTPVARFFIRNNGLLPHPVDDAEAWTFVIDGEVERPLRLIAASPVDALARTLEALLVVASQPLGVAELAEAAADDPERVETALGLLGERYRPGWLAREVHGPAQVIERGCDGMLVARRTEQPLRFLEPQCRLRRSALHVRHHPVRQEEPSARLVVACGTGRTEHASVDGRGRPQRLPEALRRRLAGQEKGR